MKLDQIKLSLLLPFNLKTFLGVYYKLILLMFLIFLWIEFSTTIIESSFLFLFYRLFFYYIVLNLFFSYGRLLLVFFYQRKNNFSHTHVDNFILGINQLSFFLNHVLFFFFFLYFLGINLAELLTSISIIAVALVLTFKDYIGNFLAGVNLMFSKEFKLGEYVKFGEIKGRINNLTFQNLELKTENGDYIYVPNVHFLAQSVTNMSKASTKNFKMEFQLSKLNHKNYTKLKEALQSALKKEFSSELSGAESVKIRIEKFEKESLTLSVDVFLSKYTYKIEDKIRLFSNEFVLKFSDSFQKGN